MDQIIYFNVDTQTSFSTDEDDISDRDDYHQENGESSNIARLETIEERLHSGDDDDGGGEHHQSDTYDKEANCGSNKSGQMYRDQGPASGHDNQIKQQQHQLNILRNLLRIERQKNQQRKDNNHCMQQYLAQLQTDYLGLQRELVETLELGHKIKAQKEAQINALDGTLKEKNKLIEQLRDNMSNLDDSRVRAGFKDLMEKQNKLAQLERDQLEEQVENAEQQLMRERVNNAQILQQFQTKLDEQLKSHETETTTLKRKLSSLEADYEKLLNEPDNLIIKNLREEKSRLSCQLDELSSILIESQSKYEMLKEGIERLMSEHEQIQSKNQEEMDQLQQQYVEQRRACNEMKLELEDRDEVVQVTRFNLQRSEKRVRNLLNALKGKEDTYKELISGLNVEHQQELAKLTSNMRSMERRLMDCQGELDKKQNEIVKLELERENQIDSIRNDRDERLIRLSQDKLKLEKELKMIETKFAHEFEDKEHRTNLVKQYQKELQYFREESKRLSLELTKAEAKLFSKQKELNDLNESKKESTQQDRMQQLEDTRLELNEAKRHSARLRDTIEEMKAENEKLRMKLRLNETNLAKLNSSISKEHTRMLDEYETRLDLIKSEQSTYDRNKIKYKRYGNKLKKYCDHLRKVHQHMCNPSVCGYVISPICPSSTRATQSEMDSDKFALFSSDDEVNSDWNTQKENKVNGCLTPIKSKYRHEKFSIKKTRTNSALSPLFNLRNE